MMTMMAFESPHVVLSVPLLPKRRTSTVRAVIHEPNGSVAVALHGVRGGDAQPTYQVMVEQRAAWQDSPEPRMATMHACMPLSDQVCSSTMSLKVPSRAVLTSK